MFRLNSVLNSPIDRLKPSAPNNLVSFTDLISCPQLLGLNKAICTVKNLSGDTVHKMFASQLHIYHHWDDAFLLAVGGKQ
jgi:hypothetical protein